MDKQKQIIRQNKYVAEKYDRFTATFPKGKKEEYRVHAEKKGLSLNGLINELIEDDIVKYKNRGDIYDKGCDKSPRRKQG
ncbi:antitoxin [Ruminococcus sp.]|uniref:antitoxin n=1 Tax=Ruminococcus sp. TaxID=41978 RepID=UPI00257E07E6|nr:antitoxin [Ruminococcus sp.]